MTLLTLLTPLNRASGSDESKFTLHSSPTILPKLTTLTSNNYNVIVHYSYIVRRPQKREEEKSIVYCRTSKYVWLT